ncbi:DDE-type integrase/transposase/recombinase [Microbacterium saccharophilum]|uniref:DDE-type integrase/transposase/recombinase n=1 Tax=Microbacterium TaxID=33882 RepID=UPI003C797811
MSEHRTSEGKLYCCAIKDVHSNRIVGYSISDRMTAKLAVDALRNAVIRRGDVAGCILHADSETACAGVLRGPDPHSDGRARMLVPGVLRGS